jgi:hypothetical protein
MKALSLKQPWVGLIMTGQKTIETRKWRTNYRGDIIICSSMNIDYPKMEKLAKELNKKELSLSYYYTLGCALGIVELYDIVRMTTEHEEKAYIEVYPGAYAWLLRNIRRYKYPHHVNGKLGLFELDIKDTNFIIK